MIAIVTETLCCMSEADLAAYGVLQVTLDCRVKGSVVADRIITAEEPVPDGEGFSIPPSEEAYRTRFGQLLQTHDGVLCITASRRFSESHRHATLAAASFGGRVIVIDSGTVAGGLFLLVLRARHYVTLGFPMSRIKAELESYKNALRASFTSSSAAVLQKTNKLSYRLPPVDPSVAEHPVFRIENGGIGVFSYAAGEEAISRDLMRVFTDGRAPGRKPPSHVVVHYANYTPTVEYLIRRIRNTYPSATVYERPITLSIQLNLGHDIVGVIGD